MADSAPQVAIVIPAHNAERFLGAALESIQAQTVSDWQALVVDDGSTDATAAVAERHLADPRFRLLQQPNGGPSAARNTGLAETRGDYVALLDADDMWRPDYLARMLRALEAAPSAPAAACGWQYLDADGQPLPQQVVIGAADAARLGETLAWQNPLVPSGMVMRAAAVRACGEFDRALHGVEDWDYVWRLTQQGALAWVPEALVLYRAHAASLSTDFERMERERMKLLHKHFGALAGPSAHWPEAARRGMAGARWQAALAWAAAGRLEAAEAKLRQVLTLWPGLALEPAAYYELGCAHQPRGYQGTPVGLDLARAEAAAGLLARAYPSERRAAQGQAHLTLAQLARVAGHRGAALRYALAALFHGAPHQRRAALRALARSVAPRPT